MVSAAYTIFQTTTPKRIDPIRIGFHFDKPPYVQHYRDTFAHTEVEFSTAQTHMVFHSSDLKQPVIGANQELFEHFEQQLKGIMKDHDKLEVHARTVRSLIAHRLKAEVPKIEDIAREMAKSVRSLQLSLKDEGHSFQEILNNVRKEISIAQLKDPQASVTDVAFFTGFSDVSVFSRNFKKWTGLTPTQFRSTI